MGRKVNINITLQRNADGSFGVKTDKLVVTATRNSEIQIGDKIVGGLLSTDLEGEFIHTSITTDKKFKSFLKKVADLPQIMLQVERIVIDIAFMDNAQGH